MKSFQILKISREVVLGLGLPMRVACPSNFIILPAHFPKGEHEVVG
jgi:hypothetical protein